MSTKLNEMKNILNKTIKEIENINITGEDNMLVVDTINDLNKQIQIIDVIQHNRKIIKYTK